jgi:hypothetical protein
MPSRVLLSLAAILAAGGCSLFGDDGVPKSQRPSNQWQVAFSETAKSDGHIEFLVSPVEGNASTVSVPVTLGQTDDEVAAAAAAAFAAALAGRYEVVKDRGPEIHVAKQDRKQPDFGLTVVRLTAQNVKVDLDRE